MLVLSTHAFFLRFCVHRIISSYISAALLMQNRSARVVYMSVRTPPYPSSRPFFPPAEYFSRTDPHINEVMVEVPSAGRCFKY